MKAGNIASFRRQPMNKEKLKPCPNGCEDGYFKINKSSMTPDGPNICDFEYVECEVCQGEGEVKDE